MRRSNRPMLEPWAPRDDGLTAWRGRACRAQANIRIMEAVANKLGIPMDKVITNLSEYGNTSAGSIPIALNEVRPLAPARARHRLTSSGI